MAPLNEDQLHVVLDIKDVRDNAVGVKSSRCCTVCMEPRMKWVAVYPCGHREACLQCAAFSRSYERDRRCPICRMKCSAVFVTAADGDTRQISFSQLPAAKLTGRADKYWYHVGMSAYFDNELLFMKTKEVLCPSEAYDPWSVLLLPATVGTIGATFCISSATLSSTSTSQKVMLVFGAVFFVAAAVIAGKFLLAWSCKQLRKELEKYDW